MVPRRCVVDTNVIATAEGLNDAASRACRDASADALLQVVTHGHLFLDAHDLILDEYLGVVNAGQPEAGGAFVKWVLQNQWVADRVTHVQITPRADGPTGFHELPAATAGIAYDRSDEKFLAVAAAHPEHPPILQSLDSKWWGWNESLRACDVTVHYLCTAEIRAKHAEKMRV